MPGNLKGDTGPTIAPLRVFAAGLDLALFAEVERDPVDVEP